MNTLAIVLGCLIALPIAADEGNPSWKMQPTGVDASLRGLCVVDAKVVWASGTSGTVLRTENAGAQWHVVPVEQATKLDFRDIHAFDAKNAVVLSAVQPARIYQTSDGGETWGRRFEHSNKEVFL